MQTLKPVQPTVSASFPTEILEIEDSDEEQSLQGFKTNIFNKLSSSSTQTTTTPNPRAEQSKQPIIEQITKQTVRPIVAEQDTSTAAKPTADQNAEQTTRPVVIEQDTSATTEQIKSSSAEQVIPPAKNTMPPIEDFSSTPPAFQDEGYGHGVSIDSMIVTSCVPTLGEQLPNVGISIDAKPQEIPQNNNKLDLLRQVVTMVVSMASSIEKELEDQALKRASLTTLAEDRQ